MIEVDAMNTIAISRQVPETERLHGMLHNQNSVYYVNGSCRQGSCTIAAKLPKESTGEERASLWYGNASDGSNQFQIGDLHRVKMCEWSCRVVDHLGASRVTVAVAFNYVDRIFESYPCQTELEYKLVCTTSLYMALKLYNRKSVRPIVLSVLSQSEILPEHIVEMEAIIMKVLAYRLSPPTSHCFVDVFGSFLNELPQDLKNRVIQKALFLSDLSVTATSLCCTLPSTIAFAAVLNALESIACGETANYSMIFTAKIGRNLDTKTVACDLMSTRKKLWRLYEHSASVDGSFRTKFATSNCSYYTNLVSITCHMQEFSPVQIIDQEVAMRRGQDLDTAINE